MSLSMPVYLQSINRPLARSPRRPVASPKAEVAQPERRRAGRLFQRNVPSTFHRCLAVHMHYAQGASALD
jgi:hypothetical protein